MPSILSSIGIRVFTTERVLDLWDAYNGYNPITSTGRKTNEIAYNKHKALFRTFPALFPINSRQNALKIITYAFNGTKDSTYQQNDRRVIDYWTMLILIDCRSFGNAKTR